MVRFSDMFHDAFMSAIRFFLNYASNEQKRYREDNAIETEREAYYALRDQKTKVTIKTNTIVHFRYLQPLGLVMGFLGILQLLNLSMLDRGQFYTDFLLVSGQYTFVYSLILFCLLNTEGRNPHVIPSFILYIIGLVVCFVMVKFNWVFSYIENTARFIHWLLLVAYLPFVLFCGHLMLHYLRRIPQIIVMVRHTKVLHKLMEVKKETTKRN